MKILCKKEKVYDYFIERYDLTGVYAGQTGVPIGVLLLHILINRDELKFVRLSAEAESEEIGVPRTIFHADSKKEITYLHQLTSLFVREELEIWRLTVKYNDEDIFITGWTHDTELSVRYTIKTRPNLLPLMSEIETATYDYHDYDPQLVYNMKSQFNLNQKMAILSIVELQKYPDIWNEFEHGMKSAPFAEPLEGAISVEGYTAEMLYKNYPLSILGAYNYLIYLKTDPENAINDLKRGLKKKIMT